MLKVREILASGVVLAASTVALSGCGQKGALYLPTEPAAAQRATLPEAIFLPHPSPPASSMAPATP